MDTFYPIYLDTYATPLYVTSCSLFAAENKYAIWAQNDGDVC